ncbi:hypothetical protein OPT61_g7290 [Boeremia exigua]|uniref:Uncharacterized protein n=1 Tax=Boeremia exigua TaxID=749465 RepID=A0ACC2I3G3_9PLEO|nr:hypothetical protein OPT61_g7290 [Boeremia exigua]
MRLLDVSSLVLHTFYSDKIPPYATLSHMWLQENEKVTFAQLQGGQWRHILGARKIRYTCKQAAKDGYKWAWVDTCCIDKTNSSELSEAINSMFQWYQKSQICYVYMVDVIQQEPSAFLGSRWWSRAWTLQELIAPAKLVFFDNKWQAIGGKRDQAVAISRKSGIDEGVLRDPSEVLLRSVATRMSWAARRQATRAEDLAYSLLGIFDIHMSMEYGEGGKAFVRLQREIMRGTQDMSLFAWNFKPESLRDIMCNAGAIPSYPYHNLLADGWSGDESLDSWTGQNRTRTIFNSHGGLTTYSKPP